MSQVTLFISLLLVHHTTQTHLEEKKCNEDVTLKCPVISDKDFFSLTWYKGDIPIIRRRKEETQPSNFSRDVSFGEDLSLFLPKVKPEDTGIYKCDIRANVGQRNKEGYVRLKVNDTECVTPTEPTPTEPMVLNLTQSNQNCPVEEFPFMWTAAGYLTVAFVKVLLSLISIQTIRVVSSRCQKNILGG
uniref:Si:dkey-109a10.2 n=1 Tax=Xiphophorus maculatus TaxID=8083 RepID=A0A3B5Q9V7_XIPMA